MFAAVGALASGGLAADARAEESGARPLVAAVRADRPPAPAQTTVTFEPGAPSADLPMSGDRAAGVPPPPRMTYLQYGVAFTAEFAAGSTFCEDPQLNCILGSGGGIAGRVGWRGAGDWYFGGAYELSKQDPTKLYRLAILQQLRFEARRYWFHGQATQPILVLAGGLAGYGNEWAVSTFGPEAFVGGGIESQLQNGPILGITVGYRPLYLVRFSDSSGNTHGPGIANMFGIEVSLEARDPL